jgi:L-seryl-tRNA(Ser) seleniumtransferase
MDDKKVAMLPFLEGSGMKSGVIVQKSHANGYHMALTNTGVKIIMVETTNELRKAVNEKTACLWFLNREAPVGSIKHEEWLNLAKEFGIPTMIDIAADVPRLKICGDLTKWDLTSFAYPAERRCRTSECRHLDG